MAELLLELRSEEIPARMQARAAADLAQLVGDGLSAVGLPAESAETFATARRLVLQLSVLASRQTEQRV